MPDLLKGAVEQGMRGYMELQSVVSEGAMWRALERAAPIIRKKERERFLALLDREIEVAEMVSHRAHVNVLKSFRSAVVAAAPGGFEHDLATLDSLEDSDG